MIIAKIFIFGGSGRVAIDLTQDLVVDGNTVTAAARHPENIIQLDGVTTDKLDLHIDVDDIFRQVKGFDAIYFTAGSRGKDFIQTGTMGAIKTMMAAEKTGVKRYIMLSLDINSWKKIPSLEDYLAAKFFADTYLMDSTDLKYTILQPGSSIEEAGTGKIQLNVEATSPNPIPDVAKTLATILKYPNTIGKVIPISSGKTPIDDALKEI